MRDTEGLERERGKGERGEANGRDGRREERIEGGKAARSALTSLYRLVEAREGEGEGGWRRRVAKIYYEPRSSSPSAFLQFPFQFFVPLFVSVFFPAAVFFAHFLKK